MNETSNADQWDSSKPIPISEEDELERLSAMIERDNLVRGLGVPEFVTEMLQTARITMKVRLTIKVRLTMKVMLRDRLLSRLCYSVQLSEH